EAEHILGHRAEDHPDRRSDDAGTTSEHPKGPVGLTTAGHDGARVHAVDVEGDVVVLDASARPTRDREGVAAAARRCTARADELLEIDALTVERDVAAHR